MRFLAALLLLANVGLFAWIYTQPAASPPVYRAVPVPPGIAPLVLLAERSGQPAATVVAVEPVESEPAEPPISEETLPEPVEEAPSPERICQTIGPLTQAEDADQIAQRLETQGYEARQRSGKVRQPSGYWVYLPAMPAADARRIVNELDKNGMKDYFIGKQNYISLGIFRRKDQAQVRLERITALGYEAILDQRYRNRTVYWLDVDEAGKPLLAASVWQQILAQHPDIRVQRVSCE